ncbi:hypothetical protein ACH5RR_027056 [Cinchona calisaya]|uniref:Uncharacterized protein n=1 Tax=Cinchona calisaya TaxID=153742 RepID=A0ABD2Z5I1_9GENT
MDANSPLDNLAENVAEEFVQGSQDSAVTEAAAAPSCAIRAAASRIAIHTTVAANDLVEFDTRPWELTFGIAVYSVVAGEIGVDATAIEPKSNDFTAAGIGEQDTAATCAEG